MPKKKNDDNKWVVLNLRNPKSIKSLKKLFQLMPLFSWILLLIALSIPFHRFDFWFEIKMKCRFRMDYYFEQMCTLYMWWPFFQSRILFWNQWTFMPIENNLHINLMRFSILTTIWKYIFGSNSEKEAKICIFIWND